MYRKFLPCCFACCGLLVACHPLDTNKPLEDQAERTAIQTASPWKPELDVRSDISIIYGMKTQKYLDFGDSEVTFEQRVRSWRNHGYKTHFMTGISWGEYEDYVAGNWDGIPHSQDAQQMKNGDTCWHHDQVPYLVPTASFVDYLKKRKIKRVIDAGIDAIYLAEPEFWAFAGYSEAFKKEWLDYYGFSWRPQFLSAENTYLSNKLKYHLFYRALNDCFTFAKKYGKRRGQNIRCYVTTHSLINYTQWQIVSPEASLASLPCVDGYVAQVWAGTARLPNYYNGVSRERIFETAYLEYGALESMTAPTGRKLFFLTDPLEDWPRNWDEYLRNYQATFVAQLLYPSVDSYLVMPWPERIYEGEYQTGKDAGKKSRIPEDFSTQMQVMIQSLNDMPLSDNRVSGPSGISVLMANSLMFQCADQPVEGYEDVEMSNYFGLVMPLLKRGVPVKMMHLENVIYPGTWADTRMLLMSYTNMKPLDPDVHRYIAEWVKQGGILVYVSEDNDPFQSVREWWNQGNNHWEHPSDHLFNLMGIAPSPSEGIYDYGKGKVCVIRRDPMYFVRTAGAETLLLDQLEVLYNADNQTTLTFKNYFTLKRGPYDLIAVMDETEDTSSYQAQGLFIDLFSPYLPVITDKEVKPGEQAFLYNLSRIPDRKKPQVLASASRVYDEELTPDVYSFIVRGPVYAQSVMRVYLPEQAKKVLVLDKKGKEQKDAFSEWDEDSHTCLIRFRNLQDGVKVMFLHNFK